MKWPLVPLGEVLTHRKEFVTIDDTVSYKRCRVQLHAQGVVLRDTVLGAEIKTKKQQVCRAHEFLVAEIDAKHGGYGLVPAELEGAVVSSHYFLFGVNAERLDRGFLDYFLRTPGFAEQVAAQGSTNYAAIRPSHVLAYTIPLPPVEEQRRIVARVDAIATRATEARRLREETLTEAQQLCRAILRDNSAGAPVLTLMSELVQLRRPDVTVQRDHEYHFAGVYCFGRGVFRGQRRKGIEFSYDKLTRLVKGNFVYPKLMAWEGALAVVPEECDGLCVSTEFPVFEIDTARVLPEVLDVYFRDPSIWPQLSGQSTGTNVRRQRLNPADFLKYQFPLPARATQERLRAVAAKLDAVRAEQQATATELDALLPSVLNRAFAGQL